MKKLILSLPLLLLLSCSTKQQTDATAVTEWNENDLNGSIKSISTYLYTSTGELSISYVEQFDEKKRLTEKIEYEGGTNIINHILYGYNDTGNPTLRRSISYEHGEKRDTSDFAYTYNDKGLNTRVEEWRNGNIFYAIDNEYNEKGLLILTTESEESRKTHYSYDKDNRLSKQQTRYTNKTYEYNKNGRLSSRKTYENGSVETGDDVLFLTETYEYDEKGRLVKETSRDAGGPSTLDYDTTLRYDDKDRLVELKIVDANGRVERHITYTFDEKDNMVEQKKLLDHSLQSEVSRYTYDEHGNWIEAEHNFNGTVCRVARDIKYYDQTQ